jgi:hypothetical protein
MPSIFVSYRRSDVPGHAGRLYDRLVERFGEDHVFKDLDTMEPGADFEEVIRDTVARCDALIAVIGGEWLARNPDGESRLDDPHDWVRLEVAEALRRNVRVIPLLVHGASLPAPSELPEDVRPLTRRHAVVLNEDVWNLQVAQLVEGLQRVMDRPPPPHPGPTDRDNESIQREIDDQPQSPTEDELDYLARGRRIESQPPGEAHEPPLGENDARWTVNLRVSTSRERTLELKFGQTAHLLTVRANLMRADDVGLDGEQLKKSLEPEEYETLRSAFTVRTILFKLVGPQGESQARLRYKQRASVGGLVWLTLDVDGERIYEDGNPDD